MANIDDTQQMSGRSGGPAGETIDIQRLIAVFRRRFRLFAIVAGAVALAVVIFSLRQTPLYTATAGVMLNTRTEKVVESQAVMSNLTADTSVVDTEVEVLKSPQLTMSVVDALHLDRDPEFNATLSKPGVVGSAIGGVRALIGGAPPAADPASVKQSVVNAVAKRLAVRRVGLTYSMTISFTSKSPTKAAEIANAFANHYISSQLDAKFNATQDANKWLNVRIETLRVQMQQADAEVSAYRVANNLLSSAGTTLTEQEISAYNQQLAKARASKPRRKPACAPPAPRWPPAPTATTSARPSAPKSSRTFAPSAPWSAAASPTSGRYGDRHPDMVRAQRELGDIDAQIQAEIRRIVSNLEARVRVSSSAPPRCKSSLGGARGTLAANSAASVRLKELEGNAESARNVYQSFLDRYKQTGAQEGH
jgi:succinoglycan biosynthesis transport protein ExoP